MTSIHSKYHLHGNLQVLYLFHGLQLEMDLHNFNFEAPLYPFYGMNPNKGTF